METKKLVIFDLDGTLLDTLADLSAAANHALGVLGLPVRTQETYRTFVGNGVGKLLERALPEGHQTPEQLAKIRSLFFDYYDKHLADFTTPYPGIKNLLSALQTRGVQLAVASNKYQNATARLIKHFFPEVHFEAVLGQREGVPVKPHPQIVQDVLLVSRTPKEQVLYVGDSEVDMQTAQQAGVHVCGVTWGFRPRETLAAYKPDFLTNDPSEILDMLA